MKKKLLLLMISAMVLVSAVNVIYGADREEIPIPAPPSHAGGGGG